jgi:outer membrane receptor for ferrienterochelin and colicin
MKYLNTILKVFLFLLPGIHLIIAGTTGKIQGVVTDKKTGDPLPGVNVIIQGTTIGSATDFNGEYVILQAPPGDHTLKVTMIGYQEVIISNVKVRADLTTKVDVQIEEVAVDIGQDVVIVAERPVIQKDVTSSTQFIDIEELERLPVIDTKEGVFLQAGVFFDPIPVAGGLGSAGRGEQRYSVRGGSQDEVKWYVDGVRTAVLVGGRADWGGSLTNVNMNAIQEVQVMTGGFSAEYGEAQSGVIKVTTKEGGEAYHGSVEYNYGIPGQHHFGNYMYDPATQKEFIDNTLPDGTLDPNWWTDYRRNQIYDYTNIPDHTVFASLSGPVPFLFHDKVAFFLSGQYKQQAYTYPHPRDTRNLENILMNLTYNEGSSKYKIYATYNHDAHSTLQENGDYISQAKYYRGWGSLLDVYNYAGNINYSSAPTAKLFYEIILSTYWVHYKERPSDYTILGSSSTRDIWGYQKYEGYAAEPFDQYTYINKNEVLTGDVSLNANLTWQFHSANMLRAGLELRYSTFDERESYRFPSITMDERYWLNRGLNEKFHPLQAAFYIEDKMEFESMILNFGVRYDYFNPNRDWFDQTNLVNLGVDPEYDAAKDPDGDQIDSDGHVKYSFENVLAKKRSPVEAFHIISPRFGVSFPISETSLLHFNYGHFTQMPPLDQMFEFSYFRPLTIVEAQMAEDRLAAQEGREPNHIVSTDGDPERVTAYTVEPLKPQKTIMFEAGIKQEFEDWAVLDVTAFYKDVFDQTEERVGLFDRSVKGVDPFTGTVSTNQSYATFLPGDYGDARGFEISLRSLFSRNFNLDLNYSFSKSTQGRASPRQVIIDENGNVTYAWDTDVNKRIAVEKSYSRPHILRANFFFRYPETLLGKAADKIFEGTTLSLLFRYVSGQAFTYLTTEDNPDTYDNYRYPASHNLDMKLDKEIKFGSQSFLVYVHITNLLNTKNLRSYGDVSFDANATKNYVESGKITTVDGGGYDISALTYYEKRKVYLGAKFTF